MFEQQVQEKKLKLFEVGHNTLVPFNLHIGLSKRMERFFGETRLIELEAFVRYLLMTFSVNSTDAPHTKKELTIDITKRPAGSTMNGDITNTPGGAFMRAFAVCELSVDHAFRHLVETISHELIHLKQYAFGELSTKKHLDGLVRWNWDGAVMDQSTTQTEYLHFPWEREAFSNQCVLVDGWVRRCNALNIKSNLIV